MESKLNKYLVIIHIEVLEGIHYFLSYFRTSLSKNKQPNTELMHNPVDIIKYVI